MRTPPARMLSLLVFLILVGCGRQTLQASHEQSQATTSTAPDTTTVFREASMNFDAANVGPFLERLSGKLPGLLPEDVERVSEGIAKTPVDSERAWVVTIQYEEESVPLRIRALMDDVDSPDLYFYSVPAVAEIIDRELKAFAKENGL
jgi:hypothetical protein